MVATHANVVCYLLVDPPPVPTQRPHPTSPPTVFFSHCTCPNRSHSSSTSLRASAHPPQPCLQRWAHPAHILPPFSVCSRPTCFLRRRSPPCVSLVCRYRLDPRGALRRELSPDSSRSYGSDLGACDLHMFSLLVVTETSDQPRLDHAMSSFFQIEVHVKLREAHKMLDA
jgi:hypothetical protein